MVDRTSRIPGVLLLQPKTFADDRGWFRELSRASALRDAGVPPLVQANHSRSRRDVLRGLHMQLDPPQAKLITCVNGTILDVVVDLRQGSPTFLQWEAFELSADDGLQVFCPIGCAHGFLVLSEEADVLYFCSAYYNPASEQTIAYDDPRIGVSWPTDSPILSERDGAAPKLPAEWSGVEVPRGDGSPRRDA